MIKKYAPYLMAALYFAAGANHFIHPSFYTKMLEGLLPYPLELVKLSGLAEMTLALGVALPATRKIASWGIILLLVAVFPANLNMAWHPDVWHIAPYLLYARLPLQLVLMYWAYRYTRATR